jgi:hypothetical protein
MRSLRRICLLCFCVLVLAFAVAIFNYVTPAKSIGCYIEDIIPHYVCSGPFARPKALLLNLPIFLIYAVLFTVGALVAYPNSPIPDQDNLMLFLMLAFLFNAILVLGLAWPVLALVERRRARRDGPTAPPPGR